MGIMSVCIMDRRMNAHAFIDKLRLNVFRQDGNPLILVQFNRQRDDMFTGKAAFLALFRGFHRVPKLLLVLPGFRRHGR